MIDRRRFLQSIAAAAATPVLAKGCASAHTLGGPMIPDPNGIMDLAEGFSYTVVSRVGELMSDGLRVPGAHDGMAAFNGENGRVILVRNHELWPLTGVAGPWRDQYPELPESLKSRFYDRGGESTPCLGGTTTTVYDPVRRRTERQFLSLAGTDLNCAGGKTPWGSWISCEESFSQPGTDTGEDGQLRTYEQRHGYVFEVPASATEAVKPVPLQAMGRFEHEAVAVHEASGAVYLTEDRWHSLFYRFLPNVKGELHKGGKLQALAIPGKPGTRTHNWESSDMQLNRSVAVQWIDLENVDGDDNDLRLRGRAAGAAVFARGEGITAVGDRIAFTCTIGGQARLGQVFSYRPSHYEGTSGETTSPGELTLIAEGNEQSLLKNCDNLTMAPWGDLIVCEDTEDDTDFCALVGIRPDGSQYVFANHAYSDSELAGVCFSPDGRTLFVNIQYPGTTIAISGPWPA